MKKGKLLLLGSIMFTLALGGCTRDSASVPQSDYVLNGVDIEFIRKATFDNYKEIEMGKYARVNGTDPGIRGYADTMVIDHSIAQVELKELADRFKMRLTEGISEEEMDEVTLQKNTPNGVQFDNRYRTFEIQDHQAAILLYQKEIKTGNHVAVKAYAQKYLLNVQSHLNRILPITP